MDLNTQLTGMTGMAVSITGGQTNKHLSELKSQLQAQANAQQQLHNLKNYVFQLRQTLQTLPAAAPQHPAEACDTARQIQDILTRQLSANIFPDFADKEYFIATCKLADDMVNYCAQNREIQSTKAPEYLQQSEDAMYIVRNEGEEWGPFSLEQLLQAKDSLPRNAQYAIYSTDGHSNWHPLSGLFRRLNTQQHSSSDVQVTCPHCSHVFVVDTQVIAEKFLCPGCGQLLALS